MQLGVGSEGGGGGERERRRVPRNDGRGGVGGRRRRRVSERDRGRLQPGTKKGGWIGMVLGRGEGGDKWCGCSALMWVWRPGVATKTGMLHC